MVKLVPPVESDYPEIYNSMLLLSRDYSTIVNYGIARIPALTKDWTDYTMTDPGILFLNAIGWAFDLQNYRLDKKFYNNVLKYTRKLNSLLSMCSYLGVNGGEYLASITTLKIEMDNSQASFSLPRGFRFKIFDKGSNSNIILNNIQDTMIYPGDNYIICIEGEVQRLTLNAGNFNNYNSYYFDQENIAYNSFYITTGNNGKVWLLDPDVLMTENTEPCFSVFRAKDKRTKLTLVPGYQGFLSESSQLNITYNLTSGTKGNVTSTSALVEAEDDFNDYNPVQEAIYYISVDGSEGGNDIFDVDRLKYEISTRNNATYTLTLPEDYDNLTKYIKDVYSIAASLDSRHNILYYVKSDSISDETAKDRIMVAINENNFLFTDIEMNPIIELPMAIGVEVILIRNHQDTASLTLQIESYIESVLGIQNQKPGTYFSRIQLASEISQLSPVINYVNITSPSNDVDVKWNEIISITGITIQYTKGG